MTITQAIEIAKSKITNDKWMRATEKAAAKLASGELIVTLLSDGALITSQNGTYRTTRKSCNCPATQAQCYHKAALALCELIETEAPTAAPVSERETITSALRAKYETKYRGNRRVLSLDGTMMEICGASVDRAPIAYLRQLLAAF
jgi:hypothetical protein